jgi:hypothetical protein
MSSTEWPRLIEPWGAIMDGIETPLLLVEVETKKEVEALLISKLEKPLIAEKNLVVHLLAEGL